MVVKIKHLYPRLLVLVYYTLFLGCNNFNEEHNPSAKLITQNDTLIAGIINVPDYSELKLPFEIKENMPIRIQAVGEGIGYDLGKGYTGINAWLNDYVGITLKSTEKNGFSKKMIFPWKSKNLPGVQSRTDTIAEGQLDPDLTCYIKEIRIPWKVLGSGNYKPGPNLQLDVAVQDIDDDGYLQSEIAWHSISKSFFGNISNLGKLMFTSPAPKDSAAYALNLKNNFLIIDGKPDDLWDAAPSYPILHIIKGEAAKEDITASFKCAWNKEYLYFLIQVNDDKKQYAQFLWDYGWIEDANEKVIWKTNYQNTRHAGGALKNRLADTIINLKAGKYILRYTSDECHSYNNWDDEPPKISFYGIMVKQSK